MLLPTLCLWEADHRWAGYEKIDIGTCIQLGLANVSPLRYLNGVDSWDPVLETYQSDRVGGEGAYSLGSGTSTRFCQCALPRLLVPTRFRQSVINAYIYLSLQHNHSLTMFSLDHRLVL